MACILIVDDEPTNLLVAITVLEAAGHRVLSAASGPEAIEMAHAEVPDLVLMDVQMPGMDGIQALSLLRADPRTAALMVCALTAYAMSGDRERLLAAGFDGYIEKPLRYKVFLDIVRDLLVRATATRGCA